MSMGQQLRTPDGRISVEPETRYGKQMRYESSFFDGSKAMCESSTGTWCGGAASEVSDGRVVGEVHWNDQWNVPPDRCGQWSAKGYRIPGGIYSTPPAALTTGNL